MFQHNTKMMSRATLARCLTTQTCVVTTQFKCKNSYTNYVRGNSSEMFYNTNLCGSDTIKMSKIQHKNDVRVSTSQVFHHTNLC